MAVGKKRGGVVQKPAKPSGAAKPRAAASIVNNGGPNGWRTKLHPQRFGGMSPKMAAIVGHITDQRLTNPHIASLETTADGHVLAQAEGDVGHNHFIGHMSDLHSNWSGLLDAAGMNAEERAQANAAFQRKLKISVTPLRRGLPESSRELLEPYHVELMFEVGDSVSKSPKRAAARSWIDPQDKVYPLRGVFRDDGRETTYHPEWVEKHPELVQDHAVYQREGLLRRRGKIDRMQTMVRMMLGGWIRKASPTVYDTGDKHFDRVVQHFRTNHRDQVQARVRLWSRKGDSTTHIVRHDRTQRR